MRCDWCWLVGVMRSCVVLCFAWSVLRALFYSIVLIWQYRSFSITDVIVTVARMSSQRTFSSTVVACRSAAGDAAIETS